MLNTLIKYGAVMLLSSLVAGGLVYDYWSGKYSNLVKEHDLANDQAKWEYARMKADYESNRSKADEEYEDSINELNSINSRVLNSREETLRSLERRLATVTNELDRVSVERGELLDAVRRYTRRVHEKFDRCDSDRVILNNVKQWSVRVYGENDE